MNAFIFMLFKIIFNKLIVATWYASIFDYIKLLESFYWLERNFSVRFMSTPSTCDVLSFLSFFSAELQVMHCKSNKKVIQKHVHYHSCFCQVLSHDSFSTEHFATAFALIKIEKFISSLRFCWQRMVMILKLDFPVRIYFFFDCGSYQRHKVFCISYRKR